MKNLFLTITVLLVCASCDNKPKETSAPQEKQLNISILLDLSDRIDPKLHPANPEHFQRDIEIVKNVTELFKKKMAKLGAWKAKGKIRVFFSPPPASPAINSIAQELNIDCAAKDNKGRKEVYDNITSLFETNLRDIYDKTIQANTWDGSDIWRFFKTDVAAYCIDSDSAYRNILIVLTDGYLYHKQSRFQNKNRFSWLLASNLQKYRAVDWQQKIEADDFGLMPERNDLSNLEVLMLEVSAENAANKIDEDIITHVLRKWLNEMNVSRYEVYSSDLPANIKMKLNAFFD